ncbi:MAG: bifunctional riboflavin kinase/FAD synthetase [Acidiferrobacterales bacterium]|nr:bifunctional riboflavin kinase/FAD synthetase [Acidiferrobacterales bacterium]
MKLVRSVESADVKNTGCVLTIGNFDAVHKGHQQILDRLNAHGQALGLPTIVMTFDPHPEEYFVKSDGASRLTDTGTRFFALQEAGIDLMVSLRFNRQLAETTAEEFVSEKLVKQLGVRLILVGDDFRFGKDRQGDFSVLQRLGRELGFTVEDTNTVLADGERISSTRIRHLLEAGDLAAAEQLLGRPYNLVGRVIYGQQLGRQWGFPTLNLAIHHKPALTGVFAVKVKWKSKQQPVFGVANLGKRPTVGGLQTLLEVHLFDFDDSLYGRRICVEFVEKIRGEQKFESFDALKAQITKDADRAREIVASRGEKV